VRERDIELYLVKRIQALGGECRKVQWIGRRGAPDRFCMFPDRSSAWVELKRPGGKLEAHQAHEHTRMISLGQTVLTLDTREKIDGWLG
jgi:hypothetical protein